MYHIEVRFRSCAPSVNSSYGSPVGDKDKTFFIAASSFLTFKSFEYDPDCKHLESVLLVVAICTVVCSKVVVLCLWRVGKRRRNSFKPTTCDLSSFYRARQPGKKVSRLVERNLETGSSAFPRPKKIKFLRANKSVFPPRGFL